MLNAILYFVPMTESQKLFDIYVLPNRIGYYQYLTISKLSEYTGKRLPVVAGKMKSRVGKISC